MCFDIHQHSLYSFFSPLCVCVCVCVCVRARARARARACVRSCVYVFTYAGAVYEEYNILTIIIIIIFEVLMSTFL